jgi:hypothetical protein
MIEYLLQNPHVRLEVEGSALRSLSTGACCHMPFL